MLHGHAGIELIFSTTASSGTAPTPTGNKGHNSDNTGSQKKSNTGAIVGGVVGGVAFLGIVLAALFFFYRRRRNQGGQYDRPDLLETTVVPYHVEPTMASSSVMQFHDYSAPSESIAPTSTTPYRPVATSESQSQSDEKLSSSQTVLSAPSETTTQPPPPSTTSPPPSNVAQSTIPGSTTTDSSIRPLPLPPDPAREQTQQDVQANIASYPGLVDTLNRLLQSLPRGGQHGDEPPPSYGA